MMKKKRMEFVVNRKRKNIKKLMSFMLLIVLNLPVFISCTQSRDQLEGDPFPEFYNNYEIENNNTLKSSNEIKVNRNIYGKIDHPEDADFFYLYNNDYIQHTYSVILNDADITGLYLEVQDKKGKIIQKGDVNQTLYFKIMPSEAVYFKVYSRASQVSPFAYNLLVFGIAKSVIMEELEPNNERGNATEIAPNTLYKGQIVPGDKDYFKVNIETANFYSISLNLIKGTADLSVYYEDIELYTIKNLNYSNAFYPVFLERGEYYIKVTGQSTVYEISYGPSQWLGEIEFNNSGDTAGEFILGNPVKGALSYSGDVDYFYIDIGDTSENYSLVIENFSMTPFFLEIINPDEENYTLEIKPGRNYFSLALKKGINLVKIYREDFKTIVNYTFEVK